MEQTKQTTEKNVNWGGARKNAGRKKKYGETTQVLTVRVPISKMAKVKEAISYILNMNTNENI